MRRNLIVAVLLVAAAGTLPATPLIGRGAGILKPMQFLGEVDFGHNQTGKKYNWTNNGWDNLADTMKTSTVSAAVIVGLAPLTNWEVLLHAPLASKSRGSASSMGIGDLELHTRYGVIAGKLAPVKLTAVAALGLPTASKDAKPPIGDGKLSGALGLVATTKQIGVAVGHLRAAYWLNGKTNDTTKVGNMFEYVAKADFNLTKTFQLWLSLAGTMQAKTEYNGTAKDQTEQDRHIGQLGAVVKPIPILSIRPKAGLPIAVLSRGGSIAPFTVGLDFWVTVP